jgi:hypothetical protein
MSTNSILATAPLVTTNFLLRATGTTIGNSLIFDNGTNVGIGNTNTTYKFDVSGTGNFTGALTGTSATFSSSVTAGSLIVNQASTAADIILKFQINGTNKWLVGLTNDVVDDNFTIYQDGAGGGNRFTINTSGNVGIGASSPSYTLSFNGDIATTIGMNQGTLGTQVPLTLKGSDGPNGTNNEGGPIYISSGLGTGNANTSNIIFSTAPSGNSGSTRQTLTERMRITSGGNVGIGTSSPSNKLHVYNNAGTNPTGTVISVETAGSTAGYGAEIKLINSNSSGRTYGWRSSGPGDGLVGSYNFALIDYTADLPRMIITSGGQVQIKQSANSHNEGLSLINTGNQVWNFVNGGDSNLYLGYAGNSRGYFNSSTGVYTPITPSDSILKDNIINYNRGLSELLKLEVKEWEYNGKAGTMAGEKTIGFIADQIVNVIPEWVSEYDVKLEESDEEKTQVKRIITNDLQYLLVKAIQEQQALITSLQTRLETLENK